MIKFERGWKNKLKDAWIKKKIRNLDFAGMDRMKIIDKFKLSQEQAAPIFMGNCFGESAKHTIGYAIDEKGDYLIDTTRKLLEFIEEIEEYMKEHDRVKVSIDAEYYDENNELSEYGSESTIEIFK